MKYFKYFIIQLLQNIVTLLIIMSKLICSFIYSWIACVVFVLFLMSSESYMEFIEYQTINHTWYNVNQLVNESINIL